MVQLFHDGNLFPNEEEGVFSLGGVVLAHFPFVRRPRRAHASPWSQATGSLENIRLRPFSQSTLGELFHGLASRYQYTQLCIS